MFKLRLIGRRNSVGCPPSASSSSSSVHTNTGSNNSTALHSVSKGGALSTPIRSFSDGGGGSSTGSANNSTASPPCLKKSRSFKTYASLSRDDAGITTPLRSGSQHLHHLHHQQQHDKRKRVRFHTIRTREYERIIGDNPSCSSGAPISIGWKYSSEVTRSLEEFERCKRYPVRDMAALVLTRQDREELLLEWGASVHEIIDAIRANVKTKQQRRRTVTAIGTYDRWEEVMENASRTIKRTLKLQKSSSPGDWYAATTTTTIITGGSATPVHHTTHTHGNPTHKNHDRRDDSSGSSNNNNRTKGNNNDTPDTAVDDGNRSATSTSVSMQEVTDVSTATSSPTSLHSLQRREQEDEAKTKNMKEDSTPRQKQQEQRPHRRRHRENQGSFVQLDQVSATGISSASSAFTSVDGSSYDSKQYATREFTTMPYPPAFASTSSHSIVEEEDGDEEEDVTTIPSRCESSVYNDDYDVECDPRYQSYEFAKVVVMNVVEHAVSKDSSLHHMNGTNGVDHAERDQCHETTRYTCSANYGADGNNHQESYYEVKCDEDFNGGDDFLANDLSEMSASTLLSQYTDLNHSRHSTMTYDDDPYEMLIRNYSYWELCPEEQDAPMVQHKVNSLIICEEESTCADEDKDNRRKPQHHNMAHRVPPLLSGSVPPPPPEFLHHIQQQQHPHIRGDLHRPAAVVTPHHDVYREESPVQRHHHLVHQHHRPAPRLHHPVPVTHYNIVDGRSMHPV